LFALPFLRTGDAGGALLLLDPRARGLAALRWLALLRLAPLCLALRRLALLRLASLCLALRRLARLRLTPLGLARLGLALLGLAT
jgi:hypothetical protein